MWLQHASLSSSREDTVLFISGGIERLSLLDSKMHGCVVNMRVWVGLDKSQTATRTILWGRQASPLLRSIIICQLYQLQKNIIIKTSVENSATFVTLPSSTPQHNASDMLSFFTLFFAFATLMCSMRFQKGNLIVSINPIVASPRAKLDPRCWGYVSILRNSRPWNEERRRAGSWWLAFTFSPVAVWVDRCVLW